MYVYINHTHLDNWSAPSCYFTPAVLNDSYNEVTAYTALAYFYSASLHNVYACRLMSHPLAIPTTTAI